jgi:hypothetical protein
MGMLLVIDIFLFGIWQYTLLPLQGNRPLSAHETRGAILPVCHAQKLSPAINVELVDGREVFGRHADGAIT